MLNKVNIFFKNFSIEGYLWISALMLLAMVNVESNHFSICPLNNLGIDFCPGCGLGRSVHHLLNFNLYKSFNAHPLGSAALLILLSRVILLGRNSLKKIKTKLSY